MMAGSRSLLAMFAHPDDETFRCGGTLALLSQRGVAVHLLTATRGEAGAPGDPPLCAASELAAVREQELRCACAALSIEPPELLDYRDGTLGTVDEEEGAAHVLAAISRIRPQVLLTWPPDGISGHPDHLAVSRWSTRAFQTAANMGPYALAALYHLAIPRSVAVALGLRQLQAIPDEDLTLAVDVMAAWDRKMAAIRCHRTQAGESPILRAPEEQQRLFLGKEHFTRAASRPTHDIMLGLKEVR